MKTNRKILYTLVLLCIFLLFLKTDYRFESTVNCCGDDHDYYIHSETIAIDRDLDYSNQLLGNEEKGFQQMEKLLLRVLLAQVYSALHLHS